MSFSPSIFDKLYIDILERGGIHTIGTKQVGKSNLKKSLTAYTINKHPETKTVIIDPEGSWQYTFSKVPFYRILPNTVKISEEITGQRLNGSNFTRKVYKIEETTKQDCLRLLESKEPVLFIVELETPEEIGFFSAWIIETIYQKQRILRKYHKGNLPKSYFVVLEESENIFDNSSLDKSIFNKLRKKYAECANLKIGILSSSQRLTEVSKKFRAKMAGYLVGHILEDDFIGLLQRMLKIKLKKDAEKVTGPQFRYSFFYTGLNQTFKVPRFEQEGTPYEVPRTEPDPQPEPKEETIKLKRQVKKPSLRERLKHLWRRFVSFPIPVNDEPTNQITYTEDEPEDLNVLLAEDNEQLDESLFSDESEDD
ncbi:MAG: hypothetical protein NWF06_03755 [Candidatus Bathyarchaeota archaeon]|nr:hypothetical protein [Candidatus Bathyarchaeum sp.]